jgi:hypothetical protein
VAAKVAKIAVIAVNFIFSLFSFPGRSSVQVSAIFDPLKAIHDGIFAARDISAMDYSSSALHSAQ